jgi:DNA modification methylase
VVNDPVHSKLISRISGLPKGQNSWQIGGDCAHRFNDKRRGPRLKPNPSGGLSFPESIVWEISEPPCFLDEQGVIYNGHFQDVLASIESNTVDLIVTDPPYGINYRGCSYSRCSGSIQKDEHSTVGRNLVMNDTAGDSLFQLHAFLLLAKRLLRPGGCCCLCCPGGARKLPILIEWTHLISRYFITKELVIWNKGGVGMGAHYRQNYEYVIVAKKAGSPCKWSGSRQASNLIHVNRCIPKPGMHPTPKPVELMSNFVKLHSDKGDIVLDPFAGQGPTLVAAKSLNRRFIGIELDSGHCAAAVEKLAACLNSKGQAA